jgi:hypothetical protein
MGGIRETTKRMKQRSIPCKKISVCAFETIDIIKLLYKFDSVASRAAQRVGITISDEEFAKLNKKREDIEVALEEYIKYGKELKLLKSSARYMVIAEKEIVTNALATSILISKLYKFDSVAVNARQKVGVTITLADFDELNKKREAIETTFEEYIDMGVKMKLIKSVKHSELDTHTKKH